MISLSFFDQAFLAAIGKARANPTIVVAVQGVTDVTGATEAFDVSGGPDDVVSYSDGTDGGTAIFDGDGNAIDAGCSGYDLIGGLGTPTVTFQSSTPNQARPDMAKTLGAGSVAVTTDGITQVVGSAEVTEISFDGATAGQIVISGSEPIAWNDDAATVEAKLEAATGRSLSVSGADGEFTVTDDANGDVADLVITSHTLTK